MSVATVCPYCNARLRISEPKPGSAIKVKCRVCKSRFHPSVAIAPASDERPTFAQPTAGEPDGAEEPALDADERRRERRHAARERLRERMARSGGRTNRPVELALAGALVLAGVAALGLFAWKALRPDPSAPRPVAFDPGEGGPDGPKAGRPQAGPALKPVLNYDPSRPLPPRLIGLWDLRSDDGRRGTFDFRANGTMEALAWEHAQETTPFKGKWNVVEERDDEISIEVGPEPGAFGNVLMTLALTSPEAFTLKMTIEDGRRNRDPQRFVRRPERRPRRRRISRDRSVVDRGTAG